MISDGVPVSMDTGLFTCSVELGPILGYDGLEAKRLGRGMMDWLIGLTGSGLIAAAAYYKRSLSASGALTAVVMGTILYAVGSPVWFGLMIGFFITSTLLTKWKQHQKKEAESVYQKTGRRDAGQVLANGGLGTLLCVAHALWPGTDWFLNAYIGVMATVTADTWATEVGGLSKGLPQSVITWKQVPKGTSGGVSTAGWVAAAAGAGFIGALALSLAAWDRSGDPAISQLYTVGWGMIGLVILSGWMGANVDSLLGATVQTLYSCRVCGREVESSRHCSQSAVRIRGLRWMDNDAVNMISSLLGGLFCASVAYFLG